MEDAKPSRTAMRVAMRRAAHQMFDPPPRVLDDPLAIAIIGDEAMRKIQAAASRERGRIARSARAFMVARSRFAEDALARAVSRGTPQLVILGAGLDTYAYRTPPSDDLRIFEVDHPATPAWKRQRLAEAGIAVPRDCVSLRSISSARRWPIASARPASMRRGRPSSAGSASCPI